jgi:hypothetical protein
MSSKLNNSPGAHNHSNFQNTSPPHNMESLSLQLQSNDLGSNSQTKLNDPVLLQKLKAHRGQMSLIVQNINNLSKKFKETLELQKQIQAAIAQGEDATEKKPD